MGLLTELRLRFRPPRLEDPAFGTLLYMHIARAPEKSYWEAVWHFAPTGSKIDISLPGTLDGPSEAARNFYLALPARFGEIVDVVRPVLDAVFREWIGRPLNPDLWQDVKLAGFAVENVEPPSMTWDVGFETTGEKWLAITIPFIDDMPQQAIVDT